MLPYYMRSSEVAECGDTLGTVLQAFYPARIFWNIMPASIGQQGHTETKIRHEQPPDCHCEISFIH